MGICNSNNKKNKKKGHESNVKENNKTPPTHDNNKTPPTHDNKKTPPTDDTACLPLNNIFFIIINLFN